MNALLNKTEAETPTPTETEKRIDNMTSEIESEIQATVEPDTISVADIIAETSTENFSAGNENEPENDEYENIRATLNEHSDDGKAGHQKWNTVSTDANVSSDGLNSSTIYEYGEQETEQPDIKDVLQSQFDIATDALRAANNKIQVAEDLLAFTKEQKHTLIYSSFREMAFFANNCKNNMEKAAEQFGGSWHQLAPMKRDKTTGDFRHALNYITHKSGVTRERLVGNSTLSMYAGILAFIHDDINDGKITWDNFHAKVCRARGGIKGFSKYAKMKTAKRNIKQGINPKPGGSLKGMSSSDADRKHKANMDKYAAAHSSSDENSDTDSSMNQRQLVSVVFDLSLSKNFPSLEIMKKLLSKKDYPEILAISTIDDVLLEIITQGEIEERGEADA